jgi:hypothetical protein
LDTAIIVGVIIGSVVAMALVFGKTVLGVAWTGNGVKRVNVGESGNHLEKDFVFILLLMLVYKALVHHNASSIVQRRNGVRVHLVDTQSAHHYHGKQKPMCSLL